MLDNTQSIICAFGLASAAPRSPYRHLELCGIALCSCVSFRRFNVPKQVKQKPGGFFRLPGTRQTMLYSYTLNIDKAQARRMCPAIRICLGAKHSTTHADGGDGMDGIHGTFLLSSLFMLPVRIHWLYHTPIYLLCQYVSR